MAATLIPMAVEAYFEVNRIWTVGVRHRLSMLRACDAGAAEAVESVFAEPLNGLINKPALLREMVIALIGDKPVAEETWIE